MEIITGYTGKPHVTSEQDRDVNIGVVGEGSYVLPTGMQLAAEVSSNNEIKIRDGVLMHQGCTASIKKNTYDSLTIINGSQGMKRIDLIVARYEKNQDNRTEGLDLKVIQGTPAESNPVVPEYTEGDIQAGDYVADMPMYQVIIDGLNITEVKKVFEVAPSIDAMKKEIAELNSKIVSLVEWKQSFLGERVYRLQFGNSNNGIIQTNQLSIPWRPEEVTVELLGLNIQGAGTVPIDYKVAYLSEQGGLYVYCSTSGASGVNLLPWQVVDATILIQRK